MKKLLLVMLILLSGFFVACSDTKEFAEEPKLDDLYYVVDTLEKKHKNLYANISEAEFKQEVGRIAEQVSHMSDVEFYYSLKYLFALIGDAHTNIYLHDDHNLYLTSLGIEIMKFDDGWHIMMIEDKNEQYLGARLMGINNMPIEEVFERSKTIISAENETWAEMQFSNTINVQQGLEYLQVIEQGEQVVLNVEDGHGNVVDVELESVKEQESDGRKFVQVKQKSIPTTSPEGIYQAKDLDEEFLYIQYNSCEEDPNLPMKQFVADVQEKLEENLDQKVIIDLRYNSGGNSTVFKPMIDLLAMMKEEREIQVYTLIGGETFSAAMINAVQTKNRLDSTLVGTATGNNVNRYGELNSFSLNNHPMTVNYSTKYFELIEGYDKDSLYPDIEVKHSFNQYLDGVDPEIQWLMGFYTEHDAYRDFYRYSDQQIYNGLSCVLVDDGYDLKAVVLYEDVARNNKCNLAFITADSYFPIGFAENEGDERWGVDFSQKQNFRYVGNGRVSVIAKNQDNGEVVEFTVQYDVSNETQSDHGFTVSTKAYK